MTPRGANFSEEEFELFESMLESFVLLQTGGRDWKTHAWPPGTGTGLLRQLLRTSAPLPSWSMVVGLLQNLGVPPANMQDFHNAYQRARLYRPWSETVRIRQNDDLPATYMINSNGGAIHLHPERRFSQRAKRVAEPVIEDAPGYTLKPDPFKANSLEELEDLARAYWEWAGDGDDLSSRVIAEQSGGAFSHATIAKIIYNKPNKPKLKQKYLLGLIRGCGGDAAEQQCWVTAYRILRSAAKAAQKRPLQIVAHNIR